MTLPTAEQVTNRYLYNQDAVPENLLNPSVVNYGLREPIIVDVKEYMMEGSGRFVSAKSFSFLHQFFSFFNIPSGSYSKQEIFSILGVSDNDNSVSFNNISYGMEDDDYADRTYIWGTVGFAIAKDAVFVVDDDGNRHIENFSIVPLQYVKADAKENFDFDGGPISDIGNNWLGLYDTIDPSRIGKTVTFDFHGEMEKTTINYEVFSGLVDPLLAYKIPAINEYNKIWELTDQLFSSGSTRFLKDGKPIIYGTANNDFLEGDLANYHAIDFHLSSHRQLGQYVTNGITYVAGAGNDQIIATQYNDILLGGTGSDTLSGGEGNDYLEGNDGVDTLNGGTGFDRLNGGAGIDTYQIDADFGSVIISGDSDGGTISLLSGVQFRRMSGNKNEDGLFAAVDTDGEWISGREDWMVSISGGVATVIIPDTEKNLRTIVIENFNITSNFFVIQLGDVLEPEIPVASDTYTVGDGYLKTYTHTISGSEHSQIIDVYVPIYRGQTNDLESGVNVEQYRDKSLIYTAEEYYKAWDTSDFQFIDNDNEDLDDYYDLYKYSRSSGDRQQLIFSNKRSLAFGAGDFLFEGSSKNDFLYGNDWTANMQTIKSWNDSQDNIFGLGSINNFDPAHHGNKDVLFGLSGDDLLIGDGDQSSLQQTSTNTPQAGNSDILIGGRGSDVIYGQGGDDVLFGMEEYRYAGAASIDLDYNPEKYGSLSEALFKKAYIYENRIDTDKKILLEDQDERNYLNGGDGNDMIVGASYNDIIEGGKDSDYIMGGAGCDVIAGGDDEDTIYGDSYIAQSANGWARDFIAPDVLPGEIAGDDLYARAYFYRKDQDMDDLFDPDTAYNDMIDGGAGDDFIAGEIGRDNISGGAGNDILFGDRPYSAGYFQGVANGFQKLSSRYHGDDMIDGGADNDKIIGGGGNDHLIGGTGNDIVYGDVGSSMYDYKASAVIPGDPAEAIKGSDDGWWGKDVIIGGAGNDELVGEGNDDTVDGGDGSDLLYGDWKPEQTEAFGNADSLTGNDALYGGAGDDQIMGNSGDDTLDGGSGNDNMFGDSFKTGSGYSGTGDDVMSGGSGDDKLYGGAGSDTLNGGAGTDYLDGGAGDDIYIFDAGNGVDLLEDVQGDSILYLPNTPVKTQWGSNNAVIYLSADGSNAIQISQNTLAHTKAFYANGELIKLAISIPATSAAANISGTQGDDTFVFDDAFQSQIAALNGLEGEDTIQLTEGWIDEGYMNVNAVTTWDNLGGYYRDKFSLANTANPAGTVKLDSTNWNAMEHIGLDTGATINLRMEGNESSNVIQGKDGNDLISGYGGNDNLYGGGGSDTLTGGVGIDTLYGEAGNDTLYVDSSDTAFGGTGADAFFMADHETSGKVNGGAGADVFHMFAGDENNYIIEDEYFDMGDVIRFDVNSDSVRMDAKRIIILREDGAEETNHGVYFSNSPEELLWNRMQHLTIRFANGETWGIDEIKAHVLAGTDFGDVMVGDATANVLHGLAGNDFIHGVEGNDSLYGDAGDDRLYGGAGNDIYHFGIGMGNDIIEEKIFDEINGFGAWSTDADVIRFDTSVTEADVRVSGMYDGFTLTVGAANESIGLGGIFSASVDTAESRERNLSIYFENNGATWDMARIEQEVFKSFANVTVSSNVKIGTTANDAALNGNSSKNYIFGNGGNDTINAQGGNDWIDGGAGNDTLTGGSGADVFRFGAGSGHDVILDAASAVVSDQVRVDFTTGIADLTIEMLASGELKIGRHDAEGVVTDSVRINKSLGNLADNIGNDLMVGSSTLLQVVNQHVASRTITLARNPAVEHFVAFSAAELLGNSFSETEKLRWQISAAKKLSGNFSAADMDSNGTQEEAFYYMENLWDTGTNYIAFLPPDNVSNASFQFTLQRDDGLTLISNMTISVRMGSLDGTSGSDIIDGEQSHSALIIQAGTGDDLVRDGDADDVVYGGEGNDVLSHNWAGNGNDIYYGDAGNDKLDAGWGTDTLVGGSGNDLYIEGNLWSGDHTTIDNSTAVENDWDVLQIGQDGYGMLDYRSLWFAADGDDLLVHQLDALASGEIRIKDWFDAANPAARLDVIRVQQDDGQVYEANIDTHFDALVQAMAAFSPPTSIAEIDTSFLVNEYQTVWNLASPIAA